MWHLENYKDSDEEYVMRSKNDNTEIMINSKPDEVTETFFELLLNRYQVGLKISTRGINFFFDCVHSLHYKCHKIKFKRIGSYIDSPNMIKNKK